MQKPLNAETTITLTSLTPGGESAVSVSYEMSPLGSPWLEQGRPVRFPLVPDANLSADAKSRAVGKHPEN